MNLDVLIVGIFSRILIFILQSSLAAALVVVIWDGTRHHARDPKENCDFKEESV
jgi:hypothetical protein